MKILFIGSSKYDYLQDILFSGLYKILGSENLKTVNFHKNYFLPLKDYPKNLGFNKKSILTFQPFGLNLQEFSAVVVGSSKPDTFRTFKKLLPKIPPHCKIIYVDGGDEPEIGGDLKRLNVAHLYPNKTERPFDHIFKREYLLNKDYNQNVHPLPFGFNFDRLNKNERLNFKYDVSFWAVESDPIRSKALKMIENEFDCSKNGTKLTQNFSDYNRKGNFYLEELNRCKITLNFRGGGWDTLRYWEVPAMGRFMISQKPGILIPNDFKEGQHIIHPKKDLSDLVEICNYYLENENEREKIAKSAEEHTKKYHSDIVRAQYLIDIITK
ncbi:glycosyltransferase [Marivirga sp.]|uniref:glycosyltransferase n=1 Tax=Marivirga sp. TaxID=2018662 RepID=UPI002D800D2E|nr:glycosyltransferase [Marivirga sp.]HET8859506.1 glycosyltransferase [Marivirga sp.]